jgi:hypothetical protein
MKPIRIYNTGGAREFLMCLNLTVDNSLTNKVTGKIKTKEYERFPAESNPGNE